MVGPEICPGHKEDTDDQNDRLHPGIRKEFIYPMVSSHSKDCRQRQHACYNSVQSNRSSKSFPKQHRMKNNKNNQRDKDH